VTQFYGVWQGLLSMPRMLLGNFINFLANWRAIAQVIEHGNPYRVSWDKTSHDFPMIGEVSRAHHMIGQILIRQGTLSTEQLNLALLDRPAGLRLGTWLVHSDRITPLQLANGVAQQFELSCESIDTWAVEQNVIDLVPAHIALHYAVFPVSHDGTTLCLASEFAISMVALAAIERQLGMNIKYLIALIGQVTVGLRHQYAHLKHNNPLKELDQAIQTGQVDPRERQRIWDYYVSRQVTLGEILQSLGRIDTTVFSAVLLQHAQTILPLGEFLVDRKIISRQTLDDAIKLQSELQPTMQMSIDQLTKSSVSATSTTVSK
jgi:bacteriophage N4 adsorption protein B